MMAREVVPLATLLLILYQFSPGKLIYLQFNSITHVVVYVGPFQVFKMSGGHIFERSTCVITCV